MATTVGINDANTLIDDYHETQTLAVPHADVRAQAIQAIVRQTSEAALTPEQLATVDAKVTEQMTVPTERFLYTRSTVVSRARARLGDAVLQKDLVNRLRILTTLFAVHTIDDAAMVALASARAKQHRKRTDKLKPLKEPVIDAAKICEGLDHGRLPHSLVENVKAALKKAEEK